MAFKWGQGEGPKWGQNAGPKWGQLLPGALFVLMNFTPPKMELAFVRLNQSNVNRLKETLPHFLLTNTNKMIFLLPKTLKGNISLINNPIEFNKSAPNRMSNDGKEFINGKLGRFKAANR